MTKICFICPTYKEDELHAYTVNALKTFFNTTADGVAVVVDDATDNWDPQYGLDLESLAKFEGQSCVLHRFEGWGGLTRSWNKGLEIARDLGCDYAICGNNDILFPPLWYQGLLHALNMGYQIVGPVSNAPGISAYESQQVWKYHTSYELTDDLDYIAEVQKSLLDSFLGTVVESKVNGFFQMAAVSTWWEGKYDSSNVYRPRNDRDSKGRKNRTPLMTLNEDELQGRWFKRGWKAAVCPSSFIFHYRAVTRGEKYRKQGGKWFRK